MDKAPCGAESQPVQIRNIAAVQLTNEDVIIICRGFWREQIRVSEQKPTLYFYTNLVDVKSIVIFSTSPILNNLNLRENNTGLTDWFVTLIIKSYLPVQPLRGFRIDKNSRPRISSGATKLESLQDCNYCFSGIEQFRVNIAEGQLMNEDQSPFAAKSTTYLFGIANETNDEH